MNAKTATYKMGYRQKAIMRLLHTSRTGYLRSGYITRELRMDFRTTHTALKGLERRGLVRRFHHGVWGLS